jgi:UDP-galactopyranose mutase
LHHAVIMQPTVVCLSHVRWRCDYERPHHLLSRCARDHRVLFFEPAELDRDDVAIEVSETRTGVLTVIPHLPPGLDQQTMENVLREIVNRVLGELGDSYPVLWYYDPMALAFTDHLEASAVIYDRPDASELAPSGTRTLRESALMKRADLVFQPDDPFDVSWDETYAKVWAEVQRVVSSSGN